MDTVRVLLAEDDRAQRERLAKRLRQSAALEVVGEAANGLEAMRLIDQMQPDVLICDMVMPQMDGFAVLEEIACMEEYRRPRVIAHTALNRNDFITRALERGVAYYMVKPADMELIVQRALMLGRRAAGRPRPEAGKPPADNAEQQVAEMLMSMGMPAHLNGYRFLLQSVLRVLEHPMELSGITRGLYPEVAGSFGTTASRVERSIRHAINLTWDRGGAQAFERVLKRRTFSASDKPTNCELIALLSERVRLSALQGRR